METQAQTQISHNRERKRPVASVKRTCYSCIRERANSLQSRITRDFRRVLGAVRELLGRRSPQSSMDSRWGTDDCLTHIFGDDYERPRLIASAKDEHEAFAICVKHFGTVEAVIEFFEEHAGYKRLPQGEPYNIGDIVVGVTLDSPFVLARVDESYLPVARMKCGYSVPHFEKVFGVFRKGGKSCRS